MVRSPGRCWSPAPASLAQPEINSVFIFITKKLRIYVYYRYSHILPKHHLLPAASAAERRAPLLQAPAMPGRKGLSAPGLAGNWGASVREQNYKATCAGPAFQVWLIRKENSSRISSTRRQEKATVVSPWVGVRKRTGTLSPPPGISGAPENSRGGLG